MNILNSCESTGQEKEITQILAKKLFSFLASPISSMFCLMETLIMEASCIF